MLGAQIRLPVSALYQVPGMYVYDASTWCVFAPFEKAGTCSNEVVLAGGLDRNSRGASSRSTACWTNSVLIYTETVVIGVVRIGSFYVHSPVLNVHVEDMISGMRGNRPRLSLPIVYQLSNHILVRAYLHHSFPPIYILRGHR